MSKAISQLPPAANAQATDQHEVNQAGVSLRETNGQLATFMETALSRLVLTVGGTSLGSDGSASFSSGVILFDAAGNIVTGGGGVNINADGSIVFAAGAGNLFNDGSVSFASSNFTVAADGVVTVFSSGIPATVINGTGVFITNGGELQADGDIRTNTVFNVAGDDGLTTDVVIGGVTLHFSGGILIQVEGA